MASLLSAQMLLRWQPDGRLFHHSSQVSLCGRLFRFLPKLSSSFACNSFANASWIRRCFSLCDFAASSCAFFFLQSNTALRFIGLRFSFFHRFLCSFKAWTFNSSSPLFSSQTRLFCFCARFLFGTPLVAPSICPFCSVHLRPYLLASRAFFLQLSVQHLHTLHHSSRCILPPNTVAACIICRWPKWIHVELTFVRKLMNLFNRICTHR